MNPGPSGFWERVQTVFAEAMAVSPADRAAFVAKVRDAGLALDASDPPVGSAIGRAR